MMYKYSVIDFGEKSTDAQAELAQFFDDCYGAQSIGFRQHFARIGRSGTVVFIVRSPHGGICAGSYIRHDGKREAIGVLDSERGKGLAQGVISFSFQRVPKQFTEISQDNFRLQKLFLDLGFDFLNTERFLYERFHQHRDLIVKIWYDGRRLMYQRVSEHNPMKVVNYVMLCRGYEEFSDA